MSLGILNLSQNTFSGGIPAEWTLMSNLKELNLYNCGLDGGSSLGLPRCTTQKRIEKRSCAQDLYRLSSFAGSLLKGAMWS